MFDSFDEFRQTYKKYLMRKRSFLIICLAFSIFAFGMELGFGTFHVGFTEAYQILFDHIKGIVPTDPWIIKADNVVWNMRLPRAIGCLAVGAGLGVCGCAMQSSLKNPLADPYTTGISSGASLGAALAIILGLSVVETGTPDAALIANAFIFALIPAAVIIFFSCVKKKISTTAIILIGIAVMYMFSAITTMLKYIGTEDNLSDIFYWGMGTMGKIDWSNVWVTVGGALAGIFLLQLLAKDLNILSISENNAETMGVDAHKMRISILIVVSIVTAIMVCFTGTIGFIGLIAPHVARMFIGNDNKYLLPASAIVGALILISADCVARNLTSTGMPVGLVTSLIGGPLFLGLLIRQRKSDW